MSPCVVAVASVVVPVPWPSLYDRGLNSTIAFAYSRRTRGTPGPDSRDLPRIRVRSLARSVGRRSPRPPRSTYPTTRPTGCPRRRTSRTSGPGRPRDSNTPGHPAQSASRTGRRRHRGGCRGRHTGPGRRPPIARPRGWPCPEPPTTTPASAGARTPHCARRGRGHRVRVGPPADRIGEHQIAGQGGSHRTDEGRIVGRVTRRVLDDLCPAGRQATVRIVNKDAVGPGELGQVTDLVIGWPSS